MPLSAPLLFAFGAMITASIADLVYRHVQMGPEPVEPLSFMALQSACFGVTVLAAAWLTGGLSFQGAGMWFAPLSGIIGVGSAYLRLRAMRQSEAGTAAATLRMNFLVTSALAVLFLGEDLSWGRALGTLTAAGAVVFLYLEVQRFAGGERAAARRKLHPFAVYAMLVLAVSHFVFKLASNYGIHPPTYALIQSLTFIVLLNTTIITTSRYRIVRRVLLFAPLCGMLLAGMSLFMLFSFRAGGAATVVVPIMQMSFVLTAVFGAVLLREGWSPCKLGGLAAAICAVWLLAAG